MNHGITHKTAVETDSLHVYLQFSGKVCKNVYIWFVKPICIATPNEVVTHSLRSTALGDMCVWLLLIKNTSDLTNSYFLPKDGCASKQMFLFALLAEVLRFMEKVDNVGKISFKSRKLLQKLNFELNFVKIRLITFLVVIMDFIPMSDLELQKKVGFLHFCIIVTSTILWPKHILLYVP